MGMFPSQIAAMVLATTVAGAVVAPASGQPAFAPNTPEASSAIILAQNSVIIRRDARQHDGGWNKRWHQRRDNRDSSRNSYNRSWQQFSPGVTPKYAYDAYGNYRVYDGRGWHDNDWRRHNWDGNDWNGNGWDGKDGWDGNGHKDRPRIYRRSTSTVQPSPQVLQDILTAVPE